MAMYTVTVNREASPPGALIEIPGVGEVPNGESADFELSEERAAFLATSPHLTVSGATGVVAPAEPAASEPSAPEVVEGGE